MNKKKQDYPYHECEKDCQAEERISSREEQSSLSHQENTQNHSHMSPHDCVDHHHHHFSKPMDIHHLGHHHHLGSIDGHGKKLLWAVIINVVLTFFQIVGGIVSGSLALIADAIHNLSDAGSLAIAAFARKVAGLPPSNKMTFGFGRAEILGALVNSTSLCVVGIYLLYESFIRFFQPQEVQGKIVIVVAAIALAIDLITVLLTFKGSKESINIRAAFIHNISDALASVVVIITGVLILWWKIYWLDLIASLLISVYILYHSYVLIKECLAILMQAVPKDLDLEEVKKNLLNVKSVLNVHHVHIWQLYEGFRSLEAHLVIHAEEVTQIEKIKKEAREILRKNFRITHSTLEVEIM